MRHASPTIQCGQCSEVKNTEKSMATLQSPNNSQAVFPADIDIEREKAENVALQEEVRRYRDENVQILDRFQEFKEEMKKKRIDSFETLLEQDKEMSKCFIELARKTEPMVMEGNNCGLFGITSTGKSTMLNSLLGEEVAETGLGETTKEIKAYPTTQYILWDVPGRNDESNYLTMEYISFFKGLNRRVILIQATVKENSSVMKLLDEINLRYIIVVNKCDRVNEQEQPKFYKQIEDEIKELELKGVDHVFFVSAKNPQNFPDWVTMINYLKLEPLIQQNNIS